VTDSSSVVVESGWTELGSSHQGDLCDSLIVDAGGST